MTGQNFKMKKKRAMDKGWKILCEIIVIKLDYLQFNNLQYLMFLLTFTFGNYVYNN